MSIRVQSAVGFASDIRTIGKTMGFKLAVSPRYKDRSGQWIPNGDRMYFDVILSKYEIGSPQDKFLEELSARLAEAKAVAESSGQKYPKGVIVHISTDPAKGTGVEITMKKATKGDKVYYNYALKVAPFAALTFERPVYGAVPAEGAPLDTSTEDPGF